MTYLLMFACSLLMFFLAGRSKSSLMIIFISLGVLIPCIFAGARDSNIGTDIGAYGTDMFVWAQDVSLCDYLKIINQAFSPGFGLVAWISANLFSSQFVYYAVAELLCIVPVCVRLFQNNLNDAWLGMLMFLLLFYPLSLNMMKQSIAVSLVFFAASYAMEGDWKKFILWTTGACFFHFTAIISFASYPIARFMCNSSVKNERILEKKIALLGFFVVICTILVFIFGVSIIRFASSLRGAYSYQLNHIGLGDFSSFVALFALVCLVIPFIAKRNLLDRFSIAKKKQFSLIVLYAVWGCVAIQFNLISESVGRIGYYGMIFLPLYFQFCLQGLREARPVYILNGVVLSLSYFVYNTILAGHNEVYPYASQILGIS